jgi:3-oxoacyl-[acyl-carrier protein] reductase
MNGKFPRLNTGSRINRKARYKMKKTIQENARRTVFVTGATSGIGSCIAVRFAGEGWDVVCHYNSSDDNAMALKKEITAYGVRCILVKADLSSKFGIDKLVKKIKTLKIDSVINNAGSYLVSRHFTKLTTDDMCKTFMVNVFAPIRITSAVFNAMKNRMFGRIVNISSIAAKYGGSSRSMHYGCSKLALEGLTKTVAREGAEFNILANTVRPGVINTDFHKKFPKDMRARIDMIPMKRMGRSEEVAEIVYYLGSEKNSFVTNETVAIAGGE